MAFISSKFNNPAWNTTTFANRVEYADMLLNKFKDAFIATNTGWELYSEIATIGTNTNLDYGCRTLQLKSSATGGKYVRIWCFQGNVGARFVTSPTSSGDASNIKIYTGNLFKCNSGNTAGYAIFDTVYAELYFGVSSSPIDVDFGLDLGLSIPLFSVTPNLVTIPGTSSHSLSTTSASNSTYQSGTTTSVLTDGKMFGILTLRSGITMAIFYAPDMFICANESDTNREGVFGTATRTNNFTVGEGSSTSPIGNSVNYAIFNQANGGFDFSGLTQDGYNNQNITPVTENSTMMVTAPVAIYMYPNTYSGSTATGVVNGIGLKGWLNTDYIRSTNKMYLPATCKGMTYGNGRWLCASSCTLICWDSSNSSPFEAA